MTVTERSQPMSEIRPLREDEVIALHDYADTGGLLCDCDSRPELCHCSTIMMLCDEWRTMREELSRSRALMGLVLHTEANHALVKALENIAIYGCGMLSHPPAMNGPEESWLRMRIAEYERCARDALAALENQS